LLLRTLSRFTGMDWVKTDNLNHSMIREVHSHKRRSQQVLLLAQHSVGL